MLFLIFLFSFSIIASIAMVAFRAWQMEKGRVPVPFFNRVDFAESFRIFAVWEKKIWDEGKHWVMRFGAQFLRIAVAVIDKARIEMRKLIARMEETLARRHAKDTQGAPSFFLKEIAEHKKKMKLLLRGRRGGEVDKL